MLAEVRTPQDTNSSVMSMMVPSIERFCVQGGALAPRVDPVAIVQTAARIRIARAGPEYVSPLIGKVPIEIIEALKQVMTLVRFEDLTSPILPVLVFALTRMRSRRKKGWTSPAFLALGLLAAGSQTALAEKVGRFDTSRDLFLPQFDCKTDVDDLHSVAAVA